MTGQQVRWTAEQVLALAPDPSSRKAGSKLAGPGPWSDTGAGQDAVWGLCRGSGSKPYRTAVDLRGPAYSCSCPSRKFPCKHALGLLLLRAADEQAVPAAAQPPQWAAQWLDGRRLRAERGATASGAAAGDGDGEAPSAGARPADARAAARRAERRMQRIAAGATELEQRLADLLRDGLAGAEQTGYAAWDEMAARMVDAQAPGLAARIRELGARPGSGPGWPARLLADCSLLHLLDRSVLGLDGLPEPLAATVRARVGLTVDAAQVLADPQGLVRDHWLVLAQYDTQEGRLTARRSWLYGQKSQHPALLLSFGAGGRAPEPGPPVGSVLDAELSYYPGTPRLRAVLGERHSAPEAGFAPAGVTVSEALTAYGTALCDDPWLDSWPAVLSEVVVIPDTSPGGRWQVADAGSDAALPITAGTAARDLWQLAAVSGGEPCTVFGECGHEGFAPHTVWDETGTPIPL